MQKIVFISFCLMALNYACSAQTSRPAGNQQPLMLDEQKELQAQLVPLDSIIDLAIKHSPTVQFQEDLVQSAKAQVEFSKRSWTNNIVGFANYSAGNQSIVSADSQTAGSQTSSNITNGLRVGVQINIPLFEFTGRKSQVKIYKFDLSSTISKKAESVQALKNLVIQSYYELLYSSNVLNIRSEAKLTASNQYSIAEKQFKDGIIDVGELSRLKTFDVNARADYEEAKRQFSTFYHQMEVLIGVPFQQLIAKR